MWRLWSGHRTTGDGDHWLKGNTVLTFETKRMDERKSDEPEGAGEYILDIDMRPKDPDKRLVFEPSAWNPAAQ